MSVLPAMSDAQFARWAALLEARTGMNLPPERRSFLTTSLAIRMREIGCVDYQSYYDLVTAVPGGVVEWSVLVDRLTVHETRFFRHLPSLRVVEEQFLNCAPAPDGPLRVDAWSVGCATGEEAYTLAMVIDNVLAARGMDYYLSISATDISLAALAAGRRAVYPRRRITEVPPAFLERYFTALGDERYQVCARLRERVCFTHRNVMETQPGALGRMDVIFCQNVLIYFDAPRRARILDMLAASLKPGGLLLLGPGEVLHWPHPDMELVRREQALAYRRRMSRQHAADAGSLQAAIGGYTS